ncbi:hypothetical protein TNCV_4616501 [Trichonephila clavipes]|nr:hypothetical protein TNCV_4616501 [Trichonephila clavipes]
MVTYTPGINCTPKNWRISSRLLLQLGCRRKREPVQNWLEPSSSCYSSECSILEALKIIDVDVSCRSPDRTGVEIFLWFPRTIVPRPVEGFLYVQKQTDCVCFIVVPIDDEVGYTEQLLCGSLTVKSVLEVRNDWSHILGWAQALVGCCATEFMIFIIPIQWN